MKKYKYYANLLKIYFSYISGRKNLGYHPVKLWIETSASCNLSCRLCVNKDLPTEEKGYMEFKLFKKIIDEAKDYVYEANLFHRGEPLMNPRIIEMIHYAADSGIKTRLHTNASLLDKKMSENIIKSGLDKISFSFDGYSKNMYEKNRIGAGYEDVLGKIDDFLKTKKSLKSKIPHTTIQIIEYDENMTLKEIKLQKTRFINLFKNNPPNRFVIRKPHNWGGSLEINGLDKKKANLKKTKISKCTFPWYALVIFYDGKVYPCPQDFFGKLNIGNCATKNINDIFADKEIVSLREKLSLKNIYDLQPCSNCDRVFRNTFMGIPIDYMGIFFKDTIGKN